MTKTEILQLKDNLDDQWLKAKCFWFGIVWLTKVINHCLKNGFGYLDTKRIDQDFYQSLSDNDKKILKTVSDWLDTSPSPLQVR